MVAAHLDTATPPRHQPHAGDLFYFHPRATNPELWRTTVPLVVRERCQRHKGLIATWTAIHWLIVLHAASGRAHFGVREIAAEAGVGRNELTGKHGHIQRLVALDLLRIVGYREIKGLPEPRPVYHIDLAELERLSLELVPEVLRDHHVERPPPAAPDPRQLPLFAPAAEAPPGSPPPPQPGPVPHLGGTGAYGFPPSPFPHPPQNGSALHGSGPGGGGGGAGAVAFGPALHGNGPGGGGGGAGAVAFGPALHENGPVWPALMPEPHQPMPEPHPNGPAPAPEGDVDRTSERTTEGASGSLPPNFLQTLIAETTRAVLATLGAQIPGILPAGATAALSSIPTPPAGAPAALSSIPTPPAGAEPLSAPVLELWQGDGPPASRRDRHQLAMIAAEVDRQTEGHGAYWLGRAILMADLCLGERGRGRSLAYLRQILRRWRDEGSWGSDRDLGEAPPRPGPAPARAERERAVPPPQPATHPAVAAYVAALRETPNTVQAAQIAATVTDLAAWNQVLTDWQLNGWGERSVGKMLDRYLKLLPAPVAPAERPPSVAAVHTYPGLTPEQRDRWIKRFHAALSAAEKRAVLARMEQEHPR